MYRHSAKQVWAVGAIVNVGWIKGLLITANPQPNVYILTRNNKTYRFENHFGIVQI